MRSIIICFCVSITFFACIVDANAQDYNTVTPFNRSTVYSDPEPSSHAPVSVPEAEIEEEVSINYGICGFSGVYFKKEDINNLLKETGCVGVRFYNGKEETSQYFSDVLAVAIDANGKELGANPNYVLSRALDLNGALVTTNVTKSHAKSCVSNLDLSNSFVRYTSYFSKSSLNEALNPKSATGLKVVPGHRVFTTSTNTEQVCRTMSIVPVMIDQNKLKNLSGTYLKGLEPCPVSCGDTGEYLVAPSNK